MYVFPFCCRLRRWLNIYWIRRGESYLTLHPNGQTHTLNHILFVSLISSVLLVTQTSASRGAKKWRRNRDLADTRRAQHFCFVFSLLNKQRQLVWSPKHLVSLAFTTSSSRSDSNWLVILLQTHAHSHTTQMSDRTGEVFFSLNFLALINIMIWLNIYIKFAITVTYIGIWLLFLLF